MPITVAIIEDEADLREELVLALNQGAEFSCVAACASAEEGLQMIPPAKPDIILQDLRLPGLSGPECIRELKKVLPDSQILVLSLIDDYESVFNAMAAGATGYLVKGAPSSKLLEAVRELHEGGSPMSASIARMVVKTFSEQERKKTGLEELTPRELEILALISRGLRQKEVAIQVGISSRTVGAHLRQIYSKLQVHSKAQAVGKFKQARPTAP